MRSLCPKQDFTADYSLTRTLKSPFMYSYKQAEKASHASRVYSFLRTRRQSLKIELHTTYSK